MTYYMHETELQMQRYDAMNMACNVKIIGDLVKSGSTFVLDLDLGAAGTDFEVGRNSRQS